MSVLLMTRFLATLLLITATSKIVPILVAWHYGEIKELISFSTCMAVIAIPCIPLVFLAKERTKNEQTINLRSTFVLVALGWFSISLTGALPFVFSGTIPGFIDAFFESASGFSTTGATILTHIEDLPKSMLLWRSLTQWLGGMGIVVLAVAVLPLLGIGGMQLFRAESPGPIYTKVSPRIKDTALKLWLVYLAFSAMQTFFLMIGGLSLYDALLHTFSTLATGGFSCHTNSISHFNSLYVNGVITFFMVLAGISFVLHYKLLSGEIKPLRKNSEIKAYLTVLLGATVLIAVNLHRDAGLDLAQSISHASFQSASIMTTTGFTSTDYELWPRTAQTILFFLMFVGGCSGSTGGGIKVIRLLTLLKQSLIELKRLVHPNAIFTLKINGNPIRKTFVYAIASFFFLYIFLVLLTTLVVSTAGLDILSSLSTALATIGNIGPGFGAVGPTQNYAFFPGPIKLFLSLVMIIGRLELYTVLVLFSPAFWKK